MQLLQTKLRERFAPTPLVIGTIAGAWGPSYLPPADRYGMGQYQEQIAVLRPGSLEALIEEIGNRVDRIDKMK